MKILVLALSGIGDALMFTPALKLLRSSLPDAQIDALVMFKGVKDIFDRNPGFNKVLYFDFLNSGILQSLKFVYKLRKKYDVSLNVYPSNRREYNFINFLLGAERRAAVKYLRKDVQNLGFLNNVRTDENDTLHNVEENVKLCEKVTGKKFDSIPDLVLPLTLEDVDFAEKSLKRFNIQPDEFVVGFHPGCATLKNQIKRRWEPEKFARLGRLLISEHKAKVFIFGGPDEKELKSKVFELIDSSDAVIIESANLANSAALMKRCTLFITNDSSLMHIASALKLKVIAIIGPTNVNYIRPWHTEHQIVSLNLECSPCFYYSPKPLTCYRNDVKFKCIKELTVKMVYDAAEKMLPR